MDSLIISSNAKKLTVVTIDIYQCNVCRECYQASMWIKPKASCSCKGLSAKINDINVDIIDTSDHKHKRNLCIVYQNYIAIPGK